MANQSNPNHNHNPKSNQKSKQCKRQRQRQRQRQHRMRELEREAASRSLNGNGSSPNLPPLPLATSSDSDEDGGGCLNTLFGHKYGALPYGNIYTSAAPPSSSLSSSSLDGTKDTKHPDWVRRDGLGTLRHFNDEQIVSILSYVDGKSLGRVVQCSRFLYVAGHHDELWRDLTLRRGGALEFRVSWKDTFAFVSARASCLAGKMCVGKDYGYGGASPPILDEERERVSSSLGGGEGGGNDVNGKLQPQALAQDQAHNPIEMKGIFSDTFFRSWLCRSFALQPSWISVNNVPVEQSTTLTVPKFLSQYEERNHPVIIRGATQNWPALQKWNKQYLIEQTRGVTFRATSGAAPLPAEFTMESYTRYCESAAEEAPLYLFDRTFDEKCPQLARDYEQALWKSCPFFDVHAEHGHDLFSLLGKGKRPDHRWIIVGPKRSGSSFHIDPNATHAWNAPIIGRKRWIFYPPGVNPPGVFPSPDGDDVMMPISLGEWFLTYWNEHVNQRLNPDRSRRPLECTVEPGDVLFVPHGWWHCVLNLDDGMSVALTQNYVSRSNLSDVLRFLKTKEGQISGCRDREDAIPPEKLYGEFGNRLREIRPELWREARDKADQGWNCRAWTDAVSFSCGRRDGNDDEDENELEDCNAGVSPSRKRGKTCGTSVLERAKGPSLVQDRKDGATENKIPSGVFSFSFL